MLAARIPVQDFIKPRNEKGDIAMPNEMQALAAYCNPGAISVTQIEESVVSISPGTLLSLLESHINVPYSDRNPVIKGVSISSSGDFIHITIGPKDEIE